MELAGADPAPDCLQAHAADLRDLLHAQQA
jgi:hypothetical protein